MQARWHFNRFTRENNLVSQALLRQVIALEPNNDLALSDLATSYTMGLPWIWYDEPQIAFAFVDINSGKFDEAVVKTRKAIALAPNSADTHGGLGGCLTLSCEWR